MSAELLNDILTGGGGIRTLRNIIIHRPKTSFFIEKGVIGQIDTHSGQILAANRAKLLSTSIWNTLVYSR